jgi:nucleoside-diphosphate kinase
MLSGPVVATVWEGKDGNLNIYIKSKVVKTGRVMLGETNPLSSKPGTIRGDYSVDIGRNVCHGSDSVESANAEIALWFKPEELCNWEVNDHKWIYE